MSTHQADSFAGWGGIPRSHLQALRVIHQRLREAECVWAVTGSVGFALQGVPVNVGDIDLQTDQEGAYEIERRFSDCIVTLVGFRASDRLRSHFGSFRLQGVEVEIMGDIQKRLTDGNWESPPDLALHRRWAELEGMRVPVLSLEYEYQAYVKLGRTDKANMLRRWLDARRDT